MSEDEGKPTLGSELTAEELQIAIGITENAAKEFAATMAKVRQFIDSRTSDEASRKAPHPDPIQERVEKLRKIKAECNQKFYKAFSARELADEEFIQRIANGEADL